MQAGDVVSLRVSTVTGVTEVVGTLVAASSESLSVRRRDGSVVHVAVDSVSAGRVVPPAPSRSITPDDLQAVMAAGWRASEVEPLGPWLLRAAGGFTGRANSALVTADPVDDLRSLLSQVRRWYADRRLPAQLQVVAAGEPAGLLDALAADGWSACAPTSVMTAEIAHVLRSRTVDVDVRLDPAPDERWLSLYRADEGPLPDVAVGVLANHPAVTFASVREGDAGLAIARAAVDGRWAGLFAVEVAAGHRRQGLGSTVSVAALRWAVRAGARRAYLQVRADNVAGVAMWERLGFVRHHDYVYWTAPGPSVSSGSSSRSSAARKPCRP